MVKEEARRGTAMLPPPSTMSEYLHGTLRGLVELPTLPHNAHLLHVGQDGNDDDGDYDDDNGGGAIRFGPTVEERIEMCDRFARYNAGIFDRDPDNDPDNDPVPDTTADPSARSGIDKEEKEEGMRTESAERLRRPLPEARTMGHGAVDAYLDLYPGGIATRSTTRTCRPTGSSGATAATNAATNNTDGAGAAPPEKVGGPGPDLLVPASQAGGVVLPPLDWNSAFRKGYSVQMWVRPHLAASAELLPSSADGIPTRTTTSSSTNSSIEDGAGAGGRVGTGAGAGRPTRSRPKTSAKTTGDAVSNDLNKPPPMVARGRSAALRTSPTAAAAAASANAGTGSLPGGGKGDKGGGGSSSTEGPQSLGFKESSPPNNEPSDVTPAQEAAARAQQAQAEREAEMNRPSVMYRFATHADNEHGVGVCAVLGKWTAYEQQQQRSSDDGATCNGGNSNGDDNGNDNNGNDGDGPDGTSTKGGTGVGDSSDTAETKKARKKKQKQRRDITHLQTTITIYSLPHHKSNPVFFVPSGSARASGNLLGSPTKRSGAGRGGAVAAGWDSGSPDAPSSPRKRYGSDSGDDGDDGDGDVAHDERMTADGNLHEANMYQFEMQQQQQQTQQQRQDAASLATATLVLPSDEWSLIGISHVLPYLKRPQISVCVNGDEIMRSELAYPVVPSDGMATSSSSSSLPGGTGPGTGFGGNDLSTPRGGATGAAGGGRASPSLGFKAGGKGGMTGQLRLGANADELPPGWMGHCSVLDNVFGYGGVRVKCRDIDGSSTPIDSDGNKIKEFVPYHVHMASIALYPEPISPTVQAIVAEFGPNSPPGMVVPPVPCVVQNRDSVVTDGHHSGHSSSSSSGRGGSGGGIAVGRGHKSGRSIGLATSIGVLAPGGHGRDSLRVNIDGGGELNLQKAMGRAVWGWGMADAMSLGPEAVPTATSRPTSSSSLGSASALDADGAVGSGRIVCPPSRYTSSIGNADSVPKVGLVQPRSPQTEQSPHGLLGDKGGLLGLGVLSSASTKGGLYEDFPGSSDRRPDAGGVLRTVGTCRLRNISQMFVLAEHKRAVKMQSQSPSRLPLTVPPSAPSTSYNMMYTSADPMSYLLLPLRLALPPPGHIHDLQGKLYRESFWHLQALFTTANNKKGSEGALLAAIIRNIASSLRLGGRCRDDVLQSGAIYTLATLMRRVLVRGYKLGLLGDANNVVAEAIDASDASDDSALEEFDDTTDGPVPPIIPPLVADASVDLIDACCGPVWKYYHGQGAVDDTSRRNLSSTSKSAKSNRRASSSGSHNTAIPAALHVRRTGDLSQTAIFGFALDFDLWGADFTASSKVLGSVVERFCTSGPVFGNGSGDLRTDGNDGSNRNYGFLLRNQFGVAMLLDYIKLSFSDTDASNGTALLSTADALSAILKTMLHHSLSSHRTISRGENDVSACIASLSDSSFGSIVPHVVLKALVDLLTESSAIRNSEESVNDHSRRPQRDFIARLARCLLMSNLHDVVAPMLLGRTVFSGKRMLEGQSASVVETSTDNKHDGLDWTTDWRRCLLLFVWLASIAGPEGEVAAKTTGSILNASGRAGSLAGCLYSNQSKAYIPSLVFPPMPVPASSSSCTSSSNREGSMEDYLKDVSYRLRVLLHLLPGLVASLTCSPQSDTSTVDARSADVISELLMGVSNSFKQIGLDFTSSRLKISSKSSKTAGQYAIKAAKEALPPMLAVTALLEDCITALKGSGSAMNGETDCASGNRQRMGSADTANTAGFVKVSQAEADVSLPDNVSTVMISSLSKLVACQNLLLETSSGLIIDAVQAGSSISTMALVLNSLQEATLDEAINLGQVKEEREESAKQTTCMPTLLPRTAHSLLCRITSTVIMKIVKSAESDSGSPWSSSELCGGVARLFDLIEEKSLLEPKPQGDKLSSDQVRLLCAIIQLMGSGRRMNGWGVNKEKVDNVDGQEDAKATDGPDSMEEESTPESFTSRVSRYIDEGLMSYDYDLYHMNDWTAGDNNAILHQEDGSKLLLPILQPCVRAALGSISDLSSTEIVMLANPSRRRSGEDDAAESEGDASRTCKISLLSALLDEMKATLQAAITDGLAFATARDLSLHALSALRSAMKNHENGDDNLSVALCKELVVEVSSYMDLRYKKEHSKREEATKYKSESDDDEKESSSDGHSVSATASSEVVERLLLGDSIADADNDKVVFPEHAATARLKHDDYKGLSEALARCIEAAFDNDRDPAVVILDELKPFIDAWDNAEKAEAEESELVELFNTSSGLIEGFGEGTAEPLSNSESAADAILSFAETSSVEQSRLLDIQLVLSSFRSKKIAYADRCMYRSWLEILDDSEFERCQSDGGRDYGSRIATVPIAPQFKRHIPHWLDHTLSLHTYDDEAEAATAIDQEDMDYEFIEATNKALGGVKIVDITQKAADEFKLEDGNLLEQDGEEVVTESISREDMQRGSFDDAGWGEHGEKDDSNRKVADESSSGVEAAGCVTNDDTVTETMTEDSIGAEEDTADAADGAVKVKTEQPHHKLESHHHRRGVNMSSFSSPPDGSMAMLGQIYSGESGISGVIEHFYQHCLHVQQAGSRKCTLLITSSHLILEYEEDGMFEEEAGHLRESRKRNEEDDAQGAATNFTPTIQASDTVDDEHETHHTTTSNPLFHQVDKSGGDQDDKQAVFEKIMRHSNSSAQMRPKTMRWNISELSHIYLRRYRLRDSALEMFLIPTAGELYGSVGLYSSLTSIFIDFGPGYEGNLKRDDAANAIMRRAPQQTIKQWPERSGQFLHEQLRACTRSWITRRMSNFEYLMSLNILAGRSFNDISQYPVFPWVLGGTSYSQDEVPSLEDPKSFRDLSKPMGALNPQRLSEFKERFESFQEAGIDSMPPFMYGSHYSTAAGVVCYFLLRLHPFSQLHRQLQSGHFDVADRLFASIPRTWEMNTGPSAAEVKELTPEFYCNPAFLRNTNNYKLGVTQDGERVDDVVLPPWANGSPEKFIEVMRLALESDICSDMLPDWIDLVFGRKQQGPEAIAADNVFFYLTYYGSVDFSSIEDDTVRQSLEDQVLHFGSCPMQLFWRPHVKKLPLSNIRIRSFDAYRMSESELPETTVADILVRPRSTKLKPFRDAPISHFCHIASPPPGPHAPLIAVRLAQDRVLAIDSQGVYHSFRWQWRPIEEAPTSKRVAEEEKDNKEGDEANSGQEKDPTEDLFHDKGNFIAQLDLPSFKAVPRLAYAPPGSTNAKAIKKGITLDQCAVVAISKTMFASRTLMLVASDGDGNGGLCCQLVTATGSIKTETIIPAVHGARISAIAMDPIGNAAGQGGVGGEVTLVGSCDGSATLWRFISSQFLPLRPRLRLGGHSGAPINAVAISSALNLCASISRERCCVFNVSNGALVRSFVAPTRNDGAKLVFAKCPALCLSQQGYIAVVCESSMEATSASKPSVSIELLTLEGIHVGSKDMAWRGMPHKMISITGGKAMMVCGRRGVSVHRISSIQPLDVIDDWPLSLDGDATEYGSSHNTAAAYDVDFGPSLVRPVIAAAACSSGALSLHALRGISVWSEEHRKNALSSAAANALARPAQRLRNVVGGVKGIGSRFLGVSKEISKEAVDVAVDGVKERTGLFGRRR